VVTATRTGGSIGAQILPRGKDGEVIYAHIGRRGQASGDVTAGLILAHEIEPSIGTDADSVVDLVIQLEAEWQSDHRVAVVTVAPNVGCARHDRIGSRGHDVLLRRTALYAVIPCEGLIAIASFSSDRPRPNARRHAASEIEMHRELGSRVAVDDLDSSHAAVNIPGQGQVARLD
jgi:hypothetical protein